MKLPKMTQGLMELILNGMVADGLLLRSADGKYIGTEMGREEVHANTVLQALTHKAGGRRCALTYCALVFVTGLTPTELNPVLAKLISTHEVDIGIVQGDETTIFSVPGKGQANLMAAPGEEKGVAYHAPDIETIKNLVAIENKKQVH